MEKTDFFWKKSFLSFLEDFWCQIVYGWVWSISRFLLYFRLMEVLQIYALNVPKIVNFLFFEKTTLNLHHISKWAKKLISGQIWAHLEFGRWKTPYYEFSMWLYSNAWCYRSNLKQRKTQKCQIKILKPTKVSIWPIKEVNDFIYTHSGSLKLYFVFRMGHFRSNLLIFARIGKNLLISEGNFFLNLLPEKNKSKISKI